MPNFKSMPRYCDNDVKKYLDIFIIRICLCNVT